MKTLCKYISTILIVSVLSTGIASGNGSRYLAPESKLAGVFSGNDITLIGLASWAEFTSGTLALPDFISSRQQTIQAVAKRTGIQLDELSEVAWLSLKGKTRGRALYVLIRRANRLIYLRFSNIAGVSDKLQDVLSGFETPLPEVSELLPHACVANQLTLPYLNRLLFLQIKEHCQLKPATITTARKTRLSQKNIFIQILIIITLPLSFVIIRTLFSALIQLFFSSVSDQKKSDIKLGWIKKLIDSFWGKLFKLDKLLPQKFKNYLLEEKCENGQQLETYKNILRFIWRESGIRKYSAFISTIMFGRIYSGLPLHPLMDHLAETFPTENNSWQVFWNMARKNAPPELQQDLDKVLVVIQLKRWLTEIWSTLTADKAALTYDNHWEWSVNGPQLTNRRKLASRSVSSFWLPQIEDIEQRLQRVFQQIQTSKPFGPALLAGIDKLRIVSGLRAFPHLEIIQEDDETILLLDMKALLKIQPQTDNLLLVFLRHGLRLSVLETIPAEDPTIRELTAYYLFIEDFLVRCPKVNINLQALPPVFRLAHNYHLDTSSTAYRYDLLRFALELLNDLTGYELPPLEQQTVQDLLQQEVSTLTDRYKSGLDIFNEILYITALHRDVQRVKKDSGVRLRKITDQLVPVPAALEQSL